MSQRKPGGSARSRASHPGATGRSASKPGRHTATTVLDVMSPDLASCFPDASLVEVARLMVAHDCGEIPVLDPETSKPLGVVTDRDIVCRAIAEGRNPLGLSAQDCMSAPAVTVTPNMGLVACCHLLEAHMIRRVPVVDDGGRCCGIVSQADLATKAPKSLSAELVRQVSMPAAGSSVVAGA
jgi:CBS domain-containing protein